jgi:transposase-like protein
MAQADASASIRVKRQYICHACHKTFAETTGTMLYDLKYPA